MRQLLQEPPKEEPKSSTQPTTKSPTPAMTTKTEMSNPTTSQPKESESEAPSVKCSTVDSETTSDADKDDSFEYWARRWQNCSPDDECLFTRTAPKSFKEWFQFYWFNALCEALDDDFDGDHIELGAGRATTSMYMLQHTECVTLVDQCDTCFGVAMGNMEKLNLPTPTMLVADVRKTNLMENYYASAYSIGLLEHFRDPVPVIEETYRILKPGGLMFHVVIETPGDGERFPKGKDWYIEAASNAGFENTQATEDLREGMFILTARK